MTFIEWIGVGLSGAVSIFFCGLLVEVAIYALKDRRLRKQRPMMVTPFGRCRVGLDSPDLIRSYKPW